MLGLESNIASESGPSSKYGFSSHHCLQLLHLSWFCTLLTLVFGRCRFCVLLQGDRVKVEEGLQISVVGHCCLFWKCFSICGSIRVSSSFLPSPVRSTWGSPRISTICATLAYKGLKSHLGIHKSKWILNHYVFFNEHWCIHESLRINSAFMHL